MARLTVLMGAPGAGKSTYAAGVGGEVVSTDNVRVTGDRGEALRGAYRRLHQLLSSGADAVFDTTASNPSIRKAALGIAQRYHAAAEIHVIDAPVEHCVSAQRGREHPAAEDAVRRIHAEVERQLPGLKYEGWSSVNIRRRR